ncbi:MAG: PIN/TRAM domain-containing protein [Patescibacteria group bacterium]
MSLLAIIGRTVLGAVFAGVGFFLAKRCFSDILLFAVPGLLPTLFAFVLGAFSILLLPLISKKVFDWFSGLVETIVQEKLSEFWEAQMDRLRHRTPQQEKVNKEAESRRSVVLDTSVIIDGRLLDIVKTGFFPTVMYVPRFVLKELQSVADSEDAIRRRRGRRGLEILEELKKIKNVKLTVLDESLSDEQEEVDQRLISVATKKDADLATVDFNLNKAAKVSGVAVLNVNELANALKTNLVPGEALELKIIREGKEKGQGVGYLDDGTMVVVEGGDQLVGETVSVEVEKALQTDAGRMIFANPSHQ